MVTFGLDQQLVVLVLMVVLRLLLEVGEDVADAGWQIILVEFERLILQFGW